MGRNEGARLTQTDFAFPTCHPNSAPLPSPPNLSCPVTPFTTPFACIARSSVVRHRALSASQWASAAAQQHPFSYSAATRSALPARSASRLRSRRQEVMVSVLKRYWLAGRNGGGHRIVV